MGLLWGEKLPPQGLIIFVSSSSRTRREYRDWDDRKNNVLNWPKIKQYNNNNKMKKKCHQNNQCHIKICTISLKARQLKHTMILLLSYTESYCLAMLI